MLRWLAPACFLLAAGGSFAQQADAAKAEALFKAGKMLDALPMYEALAAGRTRRMLRAQEAAKRAVELGDSSYVIYMSYKG